VTPKTLKELEMSEQALTVVEHSETSDLALAFEVLTAKAKRYGVYFNYYDGDQSLRYNSDRFKDIFKDLNADFTENWCAVVIDACYNRVNLLSANIIDESDLEDITGGFAGAIQRIKDRLLGTQDKTQAKLDEIIRRNEILLESDDVHKIAGVVGESFFVCGEDEEGAIGFYNDPRLVTMFYDPENPRKKRFAAKWWTAEDKTVRLTLYYPDHLEYYRTRKKLEATTGANQFEPCDADGNFTDENQAPNESGEIPVFHFKPDRRKVKSDLKNVIPLQDAVNKLASDMMITSEFGAFRQRFIISDADVEGALKNAPNEIWDIPAGDGTTQNTQVGELSASDPKTYLEPLSREVKAISAITQTPNHFFFGQGSSQISGEALIALEAPLNDKAQARIDLFAPVWKEALAYMLRVEGTSVESNQIEVVFEVPETVQPKTKAEIREINVRAGIPLVTTLRREGWSQSEIDELIVDQNEESIKAQADFQNQMLSAERQFDTGFEVSE
jgi:hypothetical protein